MVEIAAFVGHSFLENDRAVVGKFLAFFDRVSRMNNGFTWDHAEEAEAKTLSQKVLEKMNGKNLFIGICTAREQVINPEKLKPLPKKNGFVSARRAEFSWKTSDWILQEIGCAFGKEMNMMLLVENGLRTPGGLQGDMEYIQFSRDNPEESFTKILEMLQSLMPSRTSDESRHVGKSAEPVVDSESHQIEKVTQTEPNEDWTFEEYSDALISAIINGDESKELELTERYFQTTEGRDEYAQGVWRAQRLRYYHYLNKKEDTLNQALELAKKYPSHDLVAYLLGEIYESYKEYRKAADCYKESALNAKSEEKKLDRLCEAGVAYSRHGDYPAAELVLKDAGAIVSTVENGKTIILNTRARISEIQHNDDNFLAFGEGLLDKQPDDHDRRFSLAYKYSEIGENDLALYHYRILVRQKPTELVWNNLGVALDRLKLPSKSVEAYRESEKLGGTLAMSNLAQTMISAGFIDEAKAICDKATKIENYDERVGGAIARIGEISKEEEKKEVEIIEATRNRRSFYVAYSNACINPQVPDFQREWTGPDCNLSRWTELF